MSLNDALTAPASAGAFSLPPAEAVVAGFHRPFMAVRLDFLAIVFRELARLQPGFFLFAH
jgi:hypothetical protein